MRNRLLSLLLLSGATLAATLPTYAQVHYHYSYGGTRVINQRRIGLPNPSPTYMESDVLSPSAQGQSSAPNRSGLSSPSPTYMDSVTLSPSAHNQNPSSNANLPPVNMSANIRTPGDNVYAPGHIGAHPQVRRPANIQSHAPTGHYYEAGQNSPGGAVQTYGQAPTSSGKSSTARSVSRYNNTSGQSKGTRGF